MRIYLAIALLTLGVLSTGCDHRATIQIVPSAAAPTPPRDPAFAILPSLREIESTLKSTHRYQTTRLIEVLGDAEGKVEWPAQSRAWKYQPNTRVIIDASNDKFPSAERLSVDALRYQFIDGKWQVDSLFNTPALYRGIDDPSEAQVAALLQQPGLEFGLLGFGSLPTEIAFEQPPEFKRDAEGFALPTIDVRWRAKVLLIDDLAQELHSAAVTLRSTILCDVRDQRWRALPQVELLEKRILSSQGASRERLNELRWKMDRWWRNPR